MPSQFRQPIRKPSGGLLCPHCGNSFADGGQVPAAEYEKERSREDREMRGVDRYADRGHDDEAGFSRGGRVDGAGKVDGIHSRASECAHLAAGGVCRHVARGSRHDSGGGESFGGYLVKRSAARAGRRAS